MAQTQQVQRWTSDGDAEVRRRVHDLVSKALALLDEADIDSLVAARLQAALDSMAPAENEMPAQQWDHRPPHDDTSAAGTGH